MKETEKSAHKALIHCLRQRSEEYLYLTLAPNSEFPLSSLTLAMASDIREKLLKIVDGRHLSKHPFYRLWDAGKLNKDQLCEYSRQYYHLEWNFPLFLSCIHSHCEDLKTRQALVRNLYEEEVEGTHHADLWRQFQRGLGIPEDSHTNANLLPETEAAISLLRSVCSSKSVSEGLAAMFAYEAMLPEMCRLKVKGLEKFYGISDEKTIEFFTTHMTADEKHSNAWVELLHGEVDTHKLEKAALDTCNSLNLFLDGVFKAYVKVQC